MKTLLKFLTALFLAISPAAAQTVVGPQTAPPDQYVYGFDGSGNIQSSYVSFTSLLFNGVFGASTTSSTFVSTGLGNLVYSLSDITGFSVDYTVQTRCLDNPIIITYGIVTKLDTTTVTPGAITVATTNSPYTTDCANWSVQVVAGPTFGLPASSSSGVIANTFAVPALGATVTTTTDAGKAYLPGASVYVQSMSDYTAYFMASVVSYNSTTGAISLFTIQTGGSGSPTVWTISMVDLAGPSVTIVSYSSTSLNFPSDIFVGATVSMTTGTGKLFTPGSHIISNSTTDSTQLFRGISSAYNTSTGAISIFVTDVGSAASGTVASWSMFAQDGPAQNANQLGTSSTSRTIGTGSFTFTTQSGKLFPVGGVAVVSSSVNSSNAIFGTIVAYSGTSLVINVPNNGVSGSGTFAAWSIVSFPPPGGLPFLSRSGLQVSISGTTLTVTQGSIRDSTNTYDLVLPSTFTKDLTATWAAGTGNGAQVLSANLAGTISTAANAITGTSTTFTTDFTASSFGSAPVFPDFTTRGGSLSLFPSATVSTITFNGASKTISSILSNTSATFIGSATNTNITYQRGGYAGVLDASVYGVLLIRKDSDGTIDIGVYSLYPGATPDLPSGYSVFGSLAAIQNFRTPAGWSVFQWSGTSLNQISPLTTEGDLLYYHSGANTRLPVGTSGQPFVSNGTDPGYGTVAVGATYGGTGIDSHASTGVAQISSGTWSASTALANGTTATTQTAADNSTKVATTAYVDAAAGGIKPSAVYSATITPTTISGSVSSVDATNDIVTWSTTHTLVTGEVIRGIGTVPAGWTVGQQYYINALSGTTFALYTSYANAIADTSRVNITATTTGATVSHFVASAVYNPNTGLVRVGAVTGTVSAGLEFILTNSLTTFDVRADVGGLVSGGATNYASSLPIKPTSTSGQIVQFANAALYANPPTWTTGAPTFFLPASWATQGTTAFTIRLEVWGQ